MSKKTRYTGFVLTIFVLMFWVVPAGAEVAVQCPCFNLDAIGRPDPTQLKATAAYNPATQNIECTNVTDVNGVFHANVACKALSAGDGHVIMGDGNDIYVFGFHEVTGTPVDQVMNFIYDPTAPGGKEGTESSAPTINALAGQEFYLTLSNMGMFERPDLADPHTVHNHGFPNAANIFDGEPFASIAVNMGESLVYYYKFVEPGTYMYHCHEEAAEHMQMGMLGNLNVRPQQDGTTQSYNGKNYMYFAYNDCSPYVGNFPVPANDCGSTGYDVSYPLEITAFDPQFHHSDNTYNDIDFGNMRDAYQLFDGRGYPYTINPCTAADRNNPGQIRQTAYPVQSTAATGYPACTASEAAQLASQILSVPGTPVISQNVSALITAKKGQKILLHFPSLATSEFNTVTLLGLPMQLVGQGARQYRGPTGLTYYKNTQSVTLGGGEGYDILIDTSNASAGTYFMYGSNLNFLSNDAQDYGGLMTEIVIN